MLNFFNVWLTTSVRVLECLSLSGRSADVRKRQYETYEQNHPVAWKHMVEQGWIESGNTK